jgi:tetratricopeptide (TPR) repeat protein
VLSAQLADRTGEARALANLGGVACLQGRYEQAAGHFERALVLFREIGEHQAALALASRIGERYEQARAHDGLARSYRATGDHGRARHHWGDALALLTALGAPERPGAWQRLAAR